jgi:hydrogenase-4 component F
MSCALLAILLPLLAAPVLAVAGSDMVGAYAGLGLAAVLFALTLGAGVSPGSGVIHADALGVVFGMLTGFVAFTTALANFGEVRDGPAMSVGYWRRHHARCQLVLCGVLLGLYADDIALLWAGLAVAGLGLATARQEAVRAGVGPAIALFGTMVIYLAAQPALGGGLEALSLAAIDAQAGRLDGPLLTLGGLCLLIGYGGAAGLVPLQFGLGDEAGARPSLGILSGLTVNLALLAILRFSHVLQVNFSAGGGALKPGAVLIALGLASLLLAGAVLGRRQATGRLLGLSTIAQSGLTVFAFGIGGAAGVFAGLLNMILHTLTKSAAFQALMPGGAARGGAAAKRVAGSGLGAALFALTGLPPSGLFAGLFLIIGQTVRRDPLLALPLGLGLLLCAVAMVRGIGPARASAPAARGGGLVYLHLLLALVIGFAMPPVLLQALSGIAGSWS